MLNKNQQRELCYMVKIDDIRPIPGKDRVECACVGGWTVMVRKGQFKPNDIAVFFEPDSRCPETEPFAFLEKCNYKIKTQKYNTEGGKFYSQGLVMHGSDFGWEDVTDDNGVVVGYKDKERKKEYRVGDFLTDALGVTYADEEDNIRKGKDTVNEKTIMAKHKRFFKNRFVKYLMRYKFFRNLFLRIFKGKKKKKKSDYPYWVVKTDEERVQNLSYLFPKCNTKWIITEKIDGSSATFTMRNDKKRKLLVCSRNVLFDTPEKEDKNFYKDSCGNIWLEAAGKYNMEETLSQMIDDIEGMMLKKVEFVTIQGEVYGGNIQKRNYGNEHRLAIFNVIYKLVGEEPRRMNPIDGKDFCGHYGLPFVPVIASDVTLPPTCQEVIERAGGNSAIDGGMREGLVFRSEDGVKSFKAVDPEFLSKYHSN